MTNLDESTEPQAASVTVRSAGSPRCCCCLSGPAARPSSTKSSGSSCSSCPSARRRSRSACCSASSWAACAWAACCCRGICTRGTTRCASTPTSSSGIGVCGAARAVRRAAGRAGLHRHRRHGSGQPGPARGRRRHLPAAADDADGRDAAGDRALGGDDAARRVVARVTSTAATSPARWSAACWPGSTCCASTTCWSPPSSAVALNVVVAGLALLIAARTPHVVDARTTTRRRGPSPSGPVRGLVYVAIALSGLTALGAQVVWTRAAVAALRRDGLHVLADPRGLPRRPRHRQQPRRGDGRAASRIHAPRSAGARSVCARASPGRPTRPARRCRSGRSTRRSRPARRSTSSSI